jgi:uncharacterized protein involved in outer membrane biogenesis
MMRPDGTLVGTWRRRLWITIAIACAAVVAAGVAMGVFFPPWLHGTLERLAGEALGRQVKIAGEFSISFSPTPVLVAEDVNIANVPWGSGPDLLRAARVEVSFVPSSLWSPPLHLRELNLAGVRGLLETDAAGRGNWLLETKPKPDPPAAAEPGGRVVLVCDHALVSDLELTFRGPPGATPLTARVEHLDARFDPASGMVDLDASGDLDGQPWDLAGRVGTLERLYAGRDVEHSLAGHIGGARVSVRGRIGDPLFLRDPDVELELSGPDLAAALGAVRLRSPVSGPFQLRGRLAPSAGGVEFDLAGGLDGVTAAARGRVGALLEPDPIDATVEAAGPDASKVGAWTRVEGIPPRPFTIAGRVRRQGSRVALDGVEARVGGTTLQVSGVLGEPPRWVGTDLAVRSSGPDLSQLAALTRLPLQAVPFAVQGRFLRRADALAVEGVELQVNDAILRGSGTVGEPPRLAHLDLQFDASGADLARFTGLAKVALPSAPFALRGRVTRNGARFDLDGIEGRLGDDTIRVQGSLVPARRLAGTDLQAWLAGPGLAEAGERLGLRGLAAEPYEASGRLRFEDDGYQLDGVEARAGRLSAAVQGRLGRPPALDATALDCRVEGPALSDLAAWGVRAGLPGEAFAVAGGLRVENGLYRVEGVVAEVGADRVVVDGTLGPLPDLSSIDVSVAGAGRRLSDLGRFVAAAGGEPPERLPAEPYAFSGRARRLPAGLELREGRVSIGNVEIRLGGLLGSGETLRGTDVQFEVAAPDTLLVSAVAGRALPDGPLDARGRVARGASGTSFDPLSVTIGAARLQLSGILGEPPKFEGTALDVEVAGPDLSAVLGPLTGIAPLPPDAFSGSAHLEGSTGRFTSQRFAVRLGETDVEGSVAVRLEGRPFLEADLHSKRVSVRQLQDGFLGEPPAPGEAAPAAPKSNQRERLVPDTPLAFSALQRFDAKVAVTADELLVAGAELTEVTIAGELRDGALRLDRLQGTGRLGGTADASLDLEPSGDGYALRAAGTITGGRIDLWGAGEDLPQTPPIDLEFEIAGTGRSLHEIAAGSNGSALVRAGRGRIPGTVDGRLTSGILRGLLDALNPFRKSSAYTEFECGVAAVSVEDGKVTVTPIAVRTDKLTVTGSGRLDLDTERIALGWTLKPRRGVGISASSIANPYIRLGGTLAFPSLELKPLDAVVTTGAAVASFGLTVLARGFYDRMTAGQDACARALREAARDAAKRGARAAP